MSQPLALRRNALSLGTRAASTRPSSWRAEDKSVEAVAATETPVRTRIYEDDCWRSKEYDEVLDVSGMSDEDIQAFVGCPVLDSHSRWSTMDIVGVVDEARREGTELIVRFRISPTEADIASKVEAGILTKVSIGYIAVAALLYACGVL